MLRNRMPFSRIYVATDFSGPADRAVAFAAQLAESAGATLVLLHVLDPVAEFAPGTTTSEQQQKELQREAEEKLTATLAALPDVRAETRIVVAPDVAGTICKVAKDEKADLLVVASLGRTGLARFLLGSVAERVVREASCAVWVARGGQGLPARYQVCTDLSAAAAKGIALAKEAIAAFGGHAELVHALQEPSRPLALETRRRIENERREELNTLYAATLGDTPRVTLLSGASAVQAITAHAERTSPDVLVVATAGRTGLQRLLIGSVAERVVRFAPCSVLVARGRVEDTP